VTSELLWTAKYRRTRLYVLIRDEYRCKVQGPKCRGYATEVDHIVARADGGDVFDPANLRAACGPCNGRLSALRTAQLRRGRHYMTAVPDLEIRL
jgi:5-methylcytosine-specific restriction endonuclease McrA